jgi:hypothetical protein
MQSLGRHIPRRDPAPSRTAYRMQRLMLTPLYRGLFRVGLPSFIVIAACGLYLADDGRRAALTGAVADLREKFEHRPEFMVSLVSVEGAAPELADAVRAKLALNLPQSSFDIDLDAARQRIEALDLLAAATPLLPRLRGLVRMGERRWDLVLDRNQRILLPAENPVRALERLLALDEAQDMLARDLLTIDLRQDHRPTLRLGNFAFSELRKSQGFDTVENEL